MSNPSEWSVDRIEEMLYDIGMTLRERASEEPDEAEADRLRRASETAFTAHDIL